MAMGIPETSDGQALQMRGQELSPVAHIRAAVSPSVKVARAWVSTCRSLPSALWTLQRELPCFLEQVWAYLEVIRGFSAVPALVPQPPPGRSRPENRSDLDTAGLCGCWAVWQVPRP